MSEFDELVRQIHDCRKCALSEKRTNAVPGEGSPTADIMFIGEGPGFNEDRDGRPFVGRSGAFLDEMLTKIGLRRQDVYITNVVKCRPPSNRDPLPGEIEACKSYLDAQIDMIAPKVVVMLGKYSFNQFFPGESIGQARGKPRSWNGVIAYPMYHPAAALHNPRLRPVIEGDFQNLLKQLEEREAGPNKIDEAPAEQLSFF
jgi:uracil-DNA glycosylase family 4